MTPGKCPHEESVVDGKKSYCAIWGLWTNCREVGHCVYEGQKKGKPEQLALSFDFSRGGADE